MDRNSIIGFVLLLLLGTGYIFWNNQEQKAYYEQQRVDSIAQAQLRGTIENDPIIQEVKETTDSTVTSAPVIQQAEDVLVDNGDLKITFSTKGGYPLQASLNEYKTYEQEELFIFNGEENKLSFNIPINGRTVATDQLFFTPEHSKLPDGSTQLKMTAEIESGKQVIFNYILPNEGYMMNANLRLIGFEQDLATVQHIPLNWTTEALRTEKDIKNERMNMQVHFRYQDGEHDYFTLNRTPQKNLDKPMQWFGVRSHFFNSTIIADKEFQKVNFNGKEPQDETNIDVINTNTTDFEIPVVASTDFSFGFRWFIGPNDYKLLKSQNVPDMEEMIQLGFGPFFFVKYISKWLIIPLFDLLNSNLASMGLVIILMTLVIRLMLSFFTYKSHLSTAKMKVLKPELDELRKKIGDNQQQMGMEQMKLYRSAGVNPLGGCFPMLLQMPFLLSMYYFIPTAIELRQTKFLWADDLSTYDSILNFGFNIPLYGDHVSLFTLLMAATSMFLAVYNKNMTAAPTGDNQMNKMMKYMPYIMPIMFLGWFNNFAAGLTFYYTFSNIISILQQFIIQKFMINEEALLAKMEENKRKPKGTSKWQQRLDEMQKAQAEKLKQKR